MKVLIIGGKGMLGHKLVQSLERDFDVWATLHQSFGEVDRYGFFNRKQTIENVDVKNILKLKVELLRLKPDVVINCVGLVKQLRASNDVVQALLINSIFPHQLAELATELGFRLMTVSTDCIFDGKTGNYRESDQPNAPDLYGRSKNLGEITQKNCLTIRTSIIGRELATCHGLVEWFLQNRGKTVKGFTKAIFTGFPTIVFADIITDLIVKHPDLDGLYHISSEPISKFQLLNLLNGIYAAGAEILPDDDFKMDRSLDSSRFRQITGFEPQTWENMLIRMANDPTPYKEWRT